MVLSSLAHRVYVAHGTIAAANIIVLGLSVRVNMSLNFSYFSGLFPLCLSATSVVLAVLFLILDIVNPSAFSSTPGFQLVVLVLMSIFWLGCNAFSTSVWVVSRAQCSTVSIDVPDSQTWCATLNALAAFVWIDWIILLAATAALAVFVTRQYRRGQKHVWTTPLPRFAARRGHHRDPTLAVAESDLVSLRRAASVVSAASVASV